MVDTNLTPGYLVNSILLGPGVYASNVQYTGKKMASGYFDGSLTNIGIGEGILLTTGRATDAKGPNNTPNKSYVNHAPGDPDLDSIFNQTTMEAANLEFDFVPSSDTVRFYYVFASEEYHEGVCTPYNDLFGFYISGPGINGKQNLALVPGTATAVSISSINEGVLGDSIYGPNANFPYCFLNNTSYYVNNVVPQSQTIQYDGFTVLLEAKSVVVPCNTYHIKMVIAEANDPTFDSGVFIKAGSFNSQYITVSTLPEYTGGVIDSAAVEGCGKAIIHFTRYDNLSNARILNYTFSGSAILNLDYSVNSGSIHFAPGQDVFDLEIAPLYDSISDPQENIIIDLIPDFTVCSVFDPPRCIVKITDDPPLNVSVSADTFMVCAGNPIRLTAQAEGGFSDYYTYTWQWNSSVDYGASITVTPKEHTVYYVSVTDTCSTAYIHRETEVHCDLFIPAAFTPNGDNVNDYFIINTTEKTELSVYSRWGSRVYYSSFYNNSWNGNKLPEGVYLYKIQRPKELPVLGSFSLIR